MSAARLDAHVHVWDLAVRGQPWTDDHPALQRSFLLDDLAPSLRRCGVSSVVLVQTVCVPEETPELLALAASDARVSGVVGWVDLCAPGVASRLAALRALPGGDALVAVRHPVGPEPDPRWLCRDDVRRGLAAVAAAGIAYELLVLPHQLPAVLETVRALPGLSFVLDHGAIPDLAHGVDPGWAAAIVALGECENVAAKLSGLTSDDGPGEAQIAALAPFAAQLVSSFGPGRLMFGSDWPVCQLGGSYEHTFETAVSLVRTLAPERLPDVFAGAARRVFGLADAHEDMAARQ